jgi:GR25 family glycosyltransferase involved in LPS biosynthesis
MNAIFDPGNFFDAIYCISIDLRVDRREAAKRQFEKLGILQRVEFVIVKKHPRNQEEGIFQSHMECLNHGLDAGAKHILIFEDDILIQSFQPQAVTEAISFLQRIHTWDGFFLGAITSSILPTQITSVVQIKYHCLAHAYALNRSFAQKIVKLAWSGIPFDNLLRQQGENFYALAPMIAFQSTARSDNRTFFLDKMRRFFGGLPFIQRSSELFQRYKIQIILLHILVLTGLFLVFIQR